MGAALGQEQEGAQVLWTEDPEQVTLTCTPSPSLHLLIYKMGGQAEAGGKSMARLTAAGQGSPHRSRYLIREGVKARAHGIPAAKLGRLEAADDVLERSSHYKVLLLQPQLLPLEELGTV